MKRRYLLPIVFILILFLLSACRDALNLRKQSLIQTYYQGPYQWAGIKLGESTTAEVKEVLSNLGFIIEETFSEGKRFENSDNAICIEFEKGYRESGICVWFLEDIAQFIEIFGGGMTLDEIQNHLGPLEKISVFTIYRGQTLVVESKGLSTQSGFIIFNAFEKVRHGDVPDAEMIDEQTVYNVYLTNPDYIDSYYYVESDFWNFLFIEGGFEDWQGYGEYEVKDIGF